MLSEDKEKILEKELLKVTKEIVKYQEISKMRVTNAYLTGTLYGAGETKEDIFREVDKAHDLIIKHSKLMEELFKLME